jgi:hypothetical protein
MFRSPSSRRGFAHLFPLVLSTLLLVFFACSGFAQTTVGTGSIVGTIVDPSGAVVDAAKVAITNVATGHVINLTTNSSGAYNSGALIPGIYKVRATTKGFRTTEIGLTVLVGNTATGNVKLEIGLESQIVEVQGSTVQVNTEQATVQGVLSAEQIENLPVNGRNFLDLAQLEPGVQIQDGQTFDPTKAGYSSISFGGRFGRTARIEVDGVDVSDETVGTTTTDIPASGIQEFQLSHPVWDQRHSRRGFWLVPRQLNGGGVAHAARVDGAFPALAVWRACRRPRNQGQILLLPGRGTYAPARAGAGGCGRSFRGVLRDL